MTGGKTLAEMLAERRDAAPLVSRCAVDGCGWTHEGTAAEGREAALQHRLTAHPELLARGVRPKPKPAKHPSTQTAEDRRIVATLASRSRGGIRSRVTPERAAEARRRIESGEFLAAVARDVFESWGYTSVQACVNAIRRQLPDVQLHRRGKPSTLDPRMVDEAQERFAVGETIEQIALSRFEQWGFTTRKTCAAAVSRELKRRGVTVTRGGARPGSGPRPGRARTRHGDSLLTDDRVALCSRLYAAGLGLTTIAHLVYSRFGYATAEACKTRLYYRLRQAGVEFGRPQPLVPELNRLEVEQLLATLDDAAPDIERRAA